MKPADLPGIPPKPPKRMKQPRKAWIRAKLAEAEREIERLRTENATMRTHWLIRLWRWLTNTPRTGANGG